MMLSIVIAAVSPDSVVRRCVESVQHIAMGKDVQIIVVPGEPSSVFKLRARGIDQANGARIAVIGDRYEVSPGWLNALQREQRFDVLGGCVAPGPNLSYWGWCVYLTEYAHVAPPVTATGAIPPKLLPGGNVAYDAGLLRRIRPEAFATELSFHSNLAQSGAKIGISDDLEVRFVSPPRIREYIAERYWFSRMIAGENSPAAKLMLAPLLPLLILSRTASAVVRRSRYRVHLLRCFPVIFCLGVVQAAGECMGALQPRPGTHR